MEALRQQLTDLGFSPYEADLYLALLKEGTANGSQLARSSGVPRSMAYQALDRLVEKGAVLIAAGSPAVYAPVSPAEFFGRLQEQYAAACRALIQGLPQMAEPADGLVWNLKGADAIRTRAREMYFRAGGSLRTGGDVELLAQLLPGAPVSGQGTLSPGWVVLLIPQREALMVEVTATQEPVAACGRQGAFLTAAGAVAREAVARRRGQPPAAPMRQFW